MGVDVGLAVVETTEEVEAQFEVEEEKLWLLCNYQEEEAGPDFSPGSQTVAACTGLGPVPRIGSRGSNNKTSTPNKCSDP